MYATSSCFTMDSGCWDSSYSNQHLDWSKPHSLPIQASQQAPLVDGFFNVMFTIAIALFLVVEGTILIFLVKFRRRRGDDTDGLPIEGNVPLEIFWTAIPTVIVLCLGIYSVDVFNQMGGFEPAGHPHSAAHVAHKSGNCTGCYTQHNLNQCSTIAPTIGIGAVSSNLKANQQI